MKEKESNPLVDGFIEAYILIKSLTAGSPEIWQRVRFPVRDQKEVAKCYVIEIIEKPQKV